MLKHWVVTAALVAFSFLSGAGHAISPEEKAALLDSIQAFEQMIGEIETVLDDVNKTPIPSDKEQAQGHRAAKWDFVDTLRELKKELKLLERRRDRLGL